MSVGNFTTDKPLVLLDELLRLTFPVRNLYESARHQVADTRIRHLRPLFDAHYLEQLRLVDVLADRIWVLDRAKRVFAGTFPQGTRPTCVLRGRIAPDRLLRDLLDAHALVLGAADTAGANSPQTDTSADRGFAVGRVVLTNDLQSFSVREQLAVLQM